MSGVSEPAKQLVAKYWRYAEDGVTDWSLVGTKLSGAVAYATELGHTADVLFFSQKEYEAFRKAIGRTP